VSLRKNGAPLTSLNGESDLLPKPTFSPVLSPLDKIRVQILPMAEAGEGLVLEPYDTIKYEFSFLGDDYRILPGDELTVQFGPDSKRDLSLVVRPDGKITLPDVGDVMALGRTPAQLADDINTAYREQLTKPAASVSLAKSSLALGELSGEAVVQDDGLVSIPKIGRVPAAGLTVGKLSENLSGLASKRFETSMAIQVSRQLPTLDKEKEGLVGFDQLLTISADGRLALPELGTFAAAGNTLVFMQAEIQNALRSRYKSNLTVAIDIEESDNRVVYIDGEVSRPGAYPLSSNMTLLKAVTVAGGVVNTGDMRRITLIHRTSQNDVYVYITNLKDFIENGAKDNDLALSSQDIVVVPKTGIAKADLWVDQYITSILPFSRSVGYEYSQGTSKILTP
jgi:polysaccharide export outer membrane protein